MTTMTFARGDDWEGVYVDGDLIVEGHSIEARTAAELAIKHKATEVKTIYCDLDWLHDEGNLPRRMSDVKLEAGS